MPFIDQFGNDLVAYGPPVNDAPGGVLVDPLGGRSRVLGSVLRRRRVEILNYLQVNETAITTGGTYTFGTPFPVDNFDEMIVLLDRSGVPTAAPTGVQLQVQTHDGVGGANGWINLVGPIAITIPSAGYVGVLSLNQFTNFGYLVRLGVTATAVGTGTGVINGIAMLKG